MKKLFIDMILNLIGLALMALLIYLLWNGILVNLFGIPPIDYLQAAGIRILVRCLTASTGGFDTNDNQG